MTTTKNDSAKKAKTTVYMTEEEETLLNELFIKRLRERKKPISQLSFVKELSFFLREKWGASQMPKKKRFVAKKD